MFIKKKKNSLKTHKRRISDRAGTHQTVISPQNTVKGIISGTDSVHIAGCFEGEIHTEGLLHIAVGGKLQGTLKCRYAIIEGELIGDIESAEMVELRKCGRVIGHINTEKITLEEGGFIKGNIRMPKPEDKPVRFTEKRKKQSPQIKDQDAGVDDSLSPQRVKERG